MAAKRLPGKGVSRRAFLRTTGGAAAGAALFGIAGCSDTARDPAADSIRIPDPKVKLPKGDVTFRLMDSGDTKAPFWEEFFAAYEKKHPNIKTKYDGLPWERIEEVAPLGFRNRTAHDVIQLPPSIPMDQAVAEGWLAPLEDNLPDFESWKSNFPESVFAEGVNVFDGKHYAVPMTSDQRHLCLLHYNKKLMDEAGYDPGSQPFTWDDYRAAAKKITKQSKGKAYGVVLEIAQPERLANWVDYLARSAGAAGVNVIPAGYMDLRNGEFYYDRDQVADALELMLALKSDGSVFPGSNSLLAPETWPRVARGNAGMVLAGPWVTVLYEQDYKGFDFGVASNPVAGGSGELPQAYPVFGADVVHIYAESKLKTIAADVLSYVVSVDGQKAWGEFVGVGNPPINEKARKLIKDGVTAQGKKCLEIGASMVAAPSPAIANPDTAAAMREFKPVTPAFGDVIQAAFVGKIDDHKKALRKLKDDSERALDAAIEAATKKGTKVSRDDFVFSNWDPAKDYTRADYEAR